VASRLRRHRHTVEPKHLPSRLRGGRIFLNLRAPAHERTDHQAKAGGNIDPGSVTPGCTAHRVRGAKGALDNKVA